MMRTLILAASLAGVLSVAAPVGVLAQPAPGAAPEAAPVAAGTRARIPSAAAQSGIYARPGRCRELAIGRKLSGLARQRFIKRCRIARRAMPRPIPTTGPAPGVSNAVPGTPGPVPAAPKAPGQP